MPLVRAAESHALTSSAPLLYLGSCKTYETAGTTAQLVVDGANAGLSKCAVLCTHAVGVRTSEASSLVAAIRTALGARWSVAMDQNLFRWTRKQPPERWPSCVGGAKQVPAPKCCRGLFYQDRKAFASTIRPISAHPGSKIDFQRFLSPSTSRHTLAIFCRRQFSGRVGLVSSTRLVLAHSRICTSSRARSPTARRLVAMWTAALVLLALAVICFFTLVARQRRRLRVPEAVAVCLQRRRRAVVAARRALAAERAARRREWLDANAMLIQRAWHRSLRYRTVRAHRVSNELHRRSIVDPALARAEAKWASAVASGWDEDLSPATGAALLAKRPVASEAEPDWLQRAD